MSCCGGSCGGPVVPTTPKLREMGEFCAENGCKCGSDCKCDPCTCSK